MKKSEVKVAKVKPPKLIASYKLNGMLSCTNSERLRWIKEKYLVPAEFREIHKYSQTLSVAYFDPAYLQTISKEIIDGWRLKDKEKASINRLAGSIVAKQTRKENAKIVNEFKVKYNELLSNWKKEGELYYLTYRLAFWVVWVSRWAKKYQTMSGQNSYFKKEEFYFLKNDAIYLLYKSGLSKLSFYIPEEPDKVRVRMCEEHWEDMHYIDEEIAKRCRDCSYTNIKNYFSLYYQELFDVSSGLKFSFHTPYPIGSKFLPDYKSLDSVEHDEEGDGMFRFGRPVYDEEKVVYSNKRVLAEFTVAYNELFSHLGLPVKDNNKTKVLNLP